MKTSAVTVLVILGVLALIAGVFLLQSWIILVVWNSIAGYFGFKTITFGIAMCIALAIGILGGIFRGGSK